VLPVSHSSAQVVLPVATTAAGPQEVLPAAAAPLVGPPASRDSALKGADLASGYELPKFT